MPQRCLVCSHSSLGEINAILARDGPINATARQFGLSPFSILRHRDHHLKARVEKYKPALRINRNKQKVPPPDVQAEVQDDFLTEFSASGNIIDSARNAGVTRATVQLWLEHDEAFGLRFHQAKAAVVDQLEACALDRAINGAKLVREVWRGDRLIERVVEWRPQETTLVKLLQALKPEVYGERLQVTQTQIVKTVDEDAWVAV